MRSTNSRALTIAEAAHLAAVKELPCSVCNAAGPSDAHHIKQGAHFLCVALCRECHQGNGGIHGDKWEWKVRNMTEIDALQVTLARLAGDRIAAEMRSRQNSARTPSKIIPRNAA